MRSCGKIVLFFITAAAAGTVVALIIKREPEPPAPDTPRQQPSAASAPVPPRTSLPPPEALPLTTEQRTAILTRIEDMAVQYDAQQLPNLEAFLLHSDPEIRAAAVQGFVTLGEPAGAPLLRKAAQNAATPEETMRLLKAADYLELPPGSLLDLKAP